jgi:hypothetical protein
MEESFRSPFFIQRQIDMEKYKRNAEGLAQAADAAP